MLEIGDLGHRRSVIVEKGNYIYKAWSVKIGDGGDDIELYSKIETPVIFTFPGVASDVKNLKSLRFIFGLTRGLRFNTEMSPCNKFSWIKLFLENTSPTPVQIHETVGKKILCL